MWCSIKTCSIKVNTKIQKHHFLQQDNANNMDICGPNWNEGKNSANHFDNYQYFYSGNLLKESPPPPSQYMPSVYSRRDDYGQSKMVMSETPKQSVKHQCMSEDDEKKFVMQKNGNYSLTLSKYKNIVLSVFKGNVYSHFWDNKNKKHVSLNCDELACILLNKTATEAIVEQLLMVNVEKRYCTYPFEMQKNGACALNLSEDKNMVLSLFKGNIYCHIWNNKNKKHVSLNHDELMCLLSNKKDIDYITELLSQHTNQ